MKPSTKKHLRHGVESELAESIHIIPDDNGRLLLYPDSLTMAELVKTAYSLKMELQHARSIKSEDVVTKAAVLMRNDIKNQDTKQEWPPDVERDEAIIPAHTSDWRQ